MNGWMKWAWVCLVAGLLGLAVGCGPGDTTGSARVLTTLRQGAVADSIAHVTVTVSGPGMSDVTTALSRTGDTFSGVLTGLPAGTERTFTAQAFDSKGTKRFEGSAAHVTLTAGKETLVALTLQEVSPGPIFENSVPSIDSLVASLSRVEPQGKVNLEATAHDPDPGDTLSVSWSAASGTFSAPNQLSTTWTAPNVTGPVTLTLTVTDSKGASESLNLTLSVEASTDGSANVSASLNTWPRVTRITASPGRVGVGETTTVTATVTDDDGDVPAYQWTASCAGTWTGDTTPVAKFTPNAQPPGTADCGRCTLSVSTRDGHGGQNTGSLSLCVGTRPTPLYAPRIVSATQSATTVMSKGSASFHVVAEDPQGSAMTFSWTASHGTLGMPASGATSSDVSWDAPSCILGPTTVTFTATVRNALGASAQAVLTVTSGTDCPSPTWVAMGNMASDRTDHASAQLPDGRVLVAGGYSSSSSTYLASAELFDPATWSWKTTSPMSTGRRDIALTPLPSGKVLAVGGERGSTTLSSAEVYDPTMDTWTATGSMAAARYSHTLTVLTAGRVLVTGGLSGSTDLASAELYDPATGTWTGAGSMSTGRRLHSATRLPDGRVLVVGGMRLSGDLATAELYDPAKGTWTATGSLKTARRGHIATLLPSGKVLVVGGAANGNGTSLTSAELYDPATGTWTPAGNMATGRWGHAVSLLPSGLVLASGGVLIPPGSSSSTVLSSAEVYDPVTNTWSTTASMGTARRDHTINVLPSGHVLVAAGIGSVTTTQSTELFVY